nr:glycosyltransferase [Vibrio vulnificus]
MELESIVKILNDVVAIIFTYNQEKYIEDSIRSIFLQTSFPKKLIIIDDCSPDKTQEVICRVLQDKPDSLEVELRFSPENKRVIEQINSLKGEFENDTLLIFLAGDDIALPNRIEKLYKRWLSEGKSHVIHSSYVDMNEDKTLLNKHDISGSKPRTLENIIDRKIKLCGCTQVISSNVLNLFPGISASVFAEDRVIVFRGYLLKGLDIEPEVLLQYRINVGVSYTRRSTAEEILESERGYLIKEISDLQQNLADARFLHDVISERKILDRINYLKFIQNHVIGNDNDIVKISPKFLFGVFSLKPRYWCSIFRRVNGFNFLKIDSFK